MDAVMLYLFGLNVCAVLYPILLLGAFAVIPAAQVADQITRYAAQTVERNFGSVILKLHLVTADIYLQALRHDAVLLPAVFYISVYLFL